MGKYFNISELCASDTAKARGIDNTPPPAVKVKLETLINRLLDPVRERYGKPLHVSSGFRCPVLNKAVGGAADSQHMKGEAADLTRYDKTENRKLFEMIRDNFDFDQLINENDFSWVHVSFRAAGNRKKTLRIDGRNEM